MNYVRCFGDFSEIYDKSLQEQFSKLCHLNHQINICDHTMEECVHAIINVLNSKTDRTVYEKNHGLHTHIQNLLEDGVSGDQLKEYFAYKFSSLLLTENFLSSMGAHKDKVSELINIILEDEGVCFTFDIGIDEKPLLFLFDKGTPYINIYLFLYDLNETLFDLGISGEFKMSFGKPDK